MSVTAGFKQRCVRTGKTIWRTLRVRLGLAIGCSSPVASFADPVFDNPQNRYDPGPPRDLSPIGVKSRFVVLGSGLPLPLPHRRGPASAVLVNDRAYFFDAGAGIWAGIANAASVHGGEVSKALDRQRLSPLFLTHLHPDHTVGIPEFLFLSWFLGRATPIDIYGPPGTERRVDKIIEAWQDTIDAELTSGPFHAPENGWKANGIDVAVGNRGVVFKDENVTVEAFWHKHTNLDYNYAYRVTTPDRVIVIGGDGGDDDNLIEAAKDADIFVMELQTEKDLANTPWGGESLEEKRDYIGSFHIFPDQLARVAKAANVKTLVLYHLGNYSRPFDGEALLKEMRKVYDGKIYQSRDGDVF
ncbi:MBL fold metallo-hydrolase [Agrobacterium sp. rho-13.3]|uniref:MBL fold metallo-hydrolase n=1 Tax=Agrobacterium sp. rho-13.3 TaxID=3072980 RepID=UPI002A163D27|nr:MBL fold metallo-hydrolase [Agrobacterium sp. rho-13.3]MDX8310870.1 MBL fold metallo-hydrolase [Agrobacterium sp. rho-13.3]